MSEQAIKQTGHPKGLWVLFGTAMWERFNFYGMRALLSLFLADSLLMGKTDASIIYGGFSCLFYLTPMLGGYISDKFLGNRNCILLGGTAMGIAQLLLFWSASQGHDAAGVSFGTNIMWVALLAIIFGNGFFKPNISFPPFLVKQIIKERFHALSVLSLQIILFYFMSLILFGLSLLWLMLVDFSFFWLFFLEFGLFLLFLVYFFGVYLFLV